MDKTAHWENVYQTKSPSEVSWYESDPQLSLRLILEVADPTSDSVIDVGGGQSLLIDRLLDANFHRVALLDISQHAVDATRTRLGNRGANVQWFVADITQTDSLGPFHVWHDRAVFHFITDQDDRNHYIELLAHTLPIGGHFIVGTFTKGGPERCSGLPIIQYDADSMATALGQRFQLLRSLHHTHSTPAGKPQAFFFGTFRRIA